jgi:hypothetical protein
MKQQTMKDRNQADAQLKAVELQLNDKHKTAELQSRLQIEMAKLQGKQGDDAAKMQQANQKMMHDREAHQPTWRRLRRTCRPIARSWIWRDRLRRCGRATWRRGNGSGRQRRRSSNRSRRPGGRDYD